MDVEAVFSFHADVDDAVPHLEQHVTTTIIPYCDAAHGARRRIAGRAFRGLASLTAARTWNALEPPLRARMLSAGGLGAG
eukprot:10956933-Karenia_brevis.AAC.1